MKKTRFVRHEGIGAGSPIMARRQRCDGRARAIGDCVAHEYAVLAYLIGGRSRIELKGEWSLGPGDAILVPPGVPHRSLEEDSSEHWILAFHVPAFAATGAIRFFQPFEKIDRGGPAVVAVPQERRAYLEVLLDQVRASTRPSPDLNAADHLSLQSSLLNLILAELRHPAPDPRSAARPGGLVADALRFIERNCLGPITLSDVARAVDRSPAYVTSALSKATGRSVGGWVASGRMAEARRLLAYSSENVEAIAERVGYGDCGHFIRMFRREHGETPAAWRAARRASNGAP